MSNTVIFSATVKNSDSEEFLGLCYSFGMIGCEEDEQGDSTIFGCYFSTTQEIENITPLLTPLVTNFGSTEVVQDQDWNAKWRETIEPVQVTPSIWVSPEWLTPPLKDGDSWIKIEPRMAFGTGHHETTRLSSKAILATSGKSLLDVGTGSGILAFVAELSGYTDVFGFEIDPDCKINLQENLDANCKSANIEFKIGSIDVVEDGRTFDTVIMNIIRTHSTPLLSAAKGHLKKDGTLIWSGILIEEKNIVIKSATDEGFTLINETTEGEWWCGTFKL
jgi:ribosomal protein L11 methyltransferase